MKKETLTFHLADLWLVDKTRKKFLVEWLLTVFLSILLKLVGNSIIASIYFLIGVTRLCYLLVSEEKVVYVADVVLLEEVPRRQSRGQNYRGFLVQDVCSKYTQVCYEDTFYFGSKEIGHLTTLRSFRVVRYIDILRNKM